MNNSLIGLAERCEKATGPDLNLNTDIALAIGRGVPGIDRRLIENPETRPLYVNRVQPFTASIDAAMTLVPEGWVVARIGQDDGKCWWVELRRGFITSFDKVAIGKNSVWAPHWEREPPSRGCHGAALALTAAALRARAAQEPST